jgi:hypothetical protein
MELDSNAIFAVNLSNSKMQMLIFKSATRLSLGVTVDSCLEKLFLLPSTCTNNAHRSRVDAELAHEK